MAYGKMKKGKMKGKMMGDKRRDMMDKTKTKTMRRSASKKKM